jgi:predicted MFS family arabinose efflux permease
MKMAATLGRVNRKGSQLILLTFAATAAMYSRTAIGPLQEAIRTALSLSDNQIAVLQGLALALPLVIGAIPLGLAIDRLSRARLLLVLAGLGLLGSVFTALASNFFLLVAARCLVGLSAPATAITILSMIADLYPPDQRGRANMLMVLGQVAGMSSAFALGGALLASSATDWRWAMLWLAAPLVLALLLMPALWEPPRTGVRMRSPSACQSVTELWSYRAVIAPLLSGMIMVAVADGAAMVWVAPTLARRLMLPPDKVGALMGAVLLISGVLGPIVGGSLADVCQRVGGPRRTIAVIGLMTLVSIPAGLFPIAPSALSASIPLVIFLTIGAAISVTVTTLFTIVIPNELRGLCMALVGAISVLFGLGLAPLSVSLLSGAIGGADMIGDALCVVCVGTSLMGAAAFSIGRRYLPATGTIISANAEAQIL